MYVAYVYNVWFCYKECLITKGIGNKGIERFIAWHAFLHSRFYIITFKNPQIINSGRGEKASGFLKENISPFGYRIIYNLFKKEMVYLVKHIKEHTCIRASIRVWKFNFPLFWYIMADRVIEKFHF